MNPTVRKLLENIAKLSEELQKPTSGSQAVQEREVSQAFGRSSSQSTSSPSSQTSNAAASSSLAQGSTLLASSSQTQRFRLGYNFMRNKGGSKSRQKHKVQAKKVFLKDVVLLGGPKDSVVPRQGTKVLLMENKHIVSSVEFDKNWDHSTVVDKVKGLFPDKLGEFDEVELLMPVHHKLMVPQLSPGQTLSAQLIQKVFKDKPIYVRPPKELLEIYEEPPSKKKYEEIEIHSSGDEKNDDKKSDDEFKYSAFQGVLNNYCIPLAIVTPHNCNAYKFPSAAHVENENIYYTSTLAVAISVFLINLPIYISIHLSIYQFIKTNCKVMFLSSDQAESARPISESIAASDQATLHNDETADKNDQSELPSNQHTNHYHHDSETPTPLPTDVSFYDAIIEEINKKELTDPVEILRLLQTHLVKGRDLDVVDVSNSSEGATNYICVDRENILKTTFSELESIENFLLTFEVDFMGELAKDFGGPRKEWIRLVNAAMKDKYFDKGLREYLSDEYYYVGIMLGVALLQNGQLPTIIPEDMINQLIYPSINKCIVNLQKGLNKFGLVRIFQRKPVLLYLLKPRSETLNAKMLIKLLSPVFAPDGSTAHSKEKEVYAIFVKYIRQVASGRRAPVMLTSILAFVTGAEEEPVLGFAKHPSITFAHGWTNDLASEKSVCYIPTAHTCTNNLVLPRGPLLKVLPSEEKLFELYDLAFANNHFGVM